MTPTMEEVAGWLREAATECEDFRDWLESNGHTALATDKEDQGILFRNRAAQVEAMGWRPIEVAPRDGTLIDLWDGVDGARIPDCKWVSGRFVYFDDHWEEWLECCDATHFMLLPAPPVNR